MSEYTPVTINEAKGIAQSHGLQQIVVWTWADGGHGQHVTTWGEPYAHSARAAEAGNAVKAAAGWPEELRKDLPTSLVQLLEAMDRAVAEGIVEGRIHKGSALAVFYAMREAIRAKDPELAEKIIPRLTEFSERDISRRRRFKTRICRGWSWPASGWAMACGSRR
jgi:hypothetical protein